MTVSGEYIAHFECIECGHLDDAPTTTHTGDTRRDAVTAARKAGWRVDKTMSHATCPRCIERLAGKRKI